MCVRAYPWTATDANLRTQIADTRANLTDADALPEPTRKPHREPVPPVIRAQLLVPQRLQATLAESLCPSLI